MSNEFRATNDLLVTNMSLAADVLSGKIKPTKKKSEET